MGATRMAAAAFTFGVCDSHWELCRSQRLEHHRAEAGLRRVRQKQPETNMVFAALRQALHRKTNRDESRSNPMLRWRASGLPLRTQPQLARSNKCA